MQSLSSYATVTIDSAKHRAVGDLGGLQPFAQRFDRAGIVVLAKRGRNLFAGLFLIGFRAWHADHEARIREAQIRHSHCAEF